MKNFEVTHKDSGKRIEVSYKEFTLKHRHTNPVCMEAFGRMIAFEVKNERKCMALKYLEGNAKKQVESFFGVKLGKGNVFIELTDESWDDVQSTIKERETQLKEVENEFKRLVSEQPTFFRMYSLLDWGDYKINNERAVRLYRKPIDGLENGAKVLKSYTFWNDSIGDYLEDFEKDFENAGGSENVPEVDIDVETAQKWIERRSKLDAIAKVEMEKAEKVANETAEAKKTARQAKFDEAKSTGNPVELDRYCCHEDDLPVHMREDESDIVWVYRFAMPDGTIKDELSHCY